MLAKIAQNLEHLGSKSYDEKSSQLVRIDLQHQFAYDNDSILLSSLLRMSFELQVCS